MAMCVFFACGHVYHVTEPAKAGHVGTKYTLLLNKSYLVTEMEYFHSVACIKNPDKL